MAHLVFDVEGMSCSHCVPSIEGALSEVPGVRSVKTGLGWKDVGRMSEGCRKSDGRMAEE